MARLYIGRCRWHLDRHGQALMDARASLAGFREVHCGADHAEVALAVCRVALGLPPRIRAVRERYPHPCPWAPFLLGGGNAVGRYGPGQSPGRRALRKSAARPARARASA